MRKVKLSQLPVVSVWWIGRHMRYFFWGCYNRLSGRVKFKSIGKGVKFNGRVRVEHPYSNITIGDGCMFGIGCYLVAQPPTGRITIGKNASINDNCYITSCFRIEIGDNVSIAEHVSIRDYDHEFKDTTIPINKQGMYGAPVSIGDDVWIGRGVMITSGVTVGKGCVIGANAVVTKDIPDWSVAVGIPARVIRSRLPEPVSV